MVSTIIGKIVVLILAESLHKQSDGELVFVLC